MHKFTLFAFMLCALQANVKTITMQTVRLCTILRFAMLCRQHSIFGYKNYTANKAIGVLTPCQKSPSIWIHTVTTMVPHNMAV